MIRFLLKLFTSMATLMLLTQVLAGVHVSNWSTAFMAALVIGIVNSLLKPVLGLLTLPINFLSLGLFGFVLNAALFGLSAYFVPGFEVNGFISALIGSVLFGIVSALLMGLLDALIKPAALQG